LECGIAVCGWAIRVRRWCGRNVAAVTDYWVAMIVKAELAAITTFYHPRREVVSNQSESHI